jgi:hypothetical protein
MILLKWFLKKYETKAWDRPFCFRIGEQGWAIVKKLIKLWVPKFRGIS